MNDLERVRGYLDRMESMGWAPRVLCHIFAVATIPAVMAGFCIYKLSNWFVRILEVK